MPDPIVQQPKPFDTMTSWEVFNTLPYKIMSPETPYKSLRYINQQGRPFHIVHAYLWTGCEDGAKCDSHAELIRISDGMVLCKFQWDHYENPAGPHFVERHFFGADKPIIVPGDGLELRYFSKHTEPEMLNKSAHHSCDITIKYAECGDCD